MQARCSVDPWDSDMLSDWVNGACLVNSDVSILNNFLGESS